MESTMMNDLMEMVRISSESGQEEQFLRYLTEKLTAEFAASCERDTFGNLIARLPGKNSRRTRPVLFGLHADTVRPGQSIDPVLRDGVLSSVGDTVLGADDKAGIAELLEAMRRGSPRPPLEIVITREEELALNGAKNLQVGSLQSDIGFVLDMEELDGIVVGGPSHMLIDIEITGRSAHAGIEPEKGISAIRVASQAIALLQEGWADRETTVNVGTIEGGEIRNGVPEKVQIKAECRSLDHQKCLVQGERIRQTFELIAQLAGAKSKIDLTLAYKAVLVPPNALVVSFAERALRHVGIEPRRIVICGGTDASILNAKGIQTVALGTGMMNPHTVEESIAESEMVRAAEVIVQLFALLAEDV